MRQSAFIASLRAFAVALPLSLLVGGAASAQIPGPASPANGFGQAGQANGAEGGADAKKNNDLDGGSVLSSNFDKTASSEFMDPIGEEEVSENGYNSLNKETTNNTPVIYQDPESGVAAIMQENAWRKMSTNLLNSPLALMHVTWQLTEPAVAQGFSNAFQQSAWVNQLAFGSQQTLMEQYKLGGTQGFGQAVSTLNCMREQILEQQKRSESENWQKARMACQGAYDITQPTGSGSSRAVEEGKVDGSIASLNLDPSLKLIDCDQMEEDRKSEASKPVHLRTKGIMSFVDVRLQNLEEEKRQKMKEEIGDIIYSYRHEHSGDPNKPNRAVLLASCIKPPSVPLWEQSKQQEKIIWESLFSLFHSRCKAAVQERADRTAYIPFDPARRTNFWDNSQRYAASLSLKKGFRFTPNFLDIMYNLFITKEIGELTTERCDERLLPTNDRNNLDKLKAGESKVRLEHRTLHQLVLWITQGQMFERAAERVREIDATSQGMNRESDGRAAIIPVMYYLVARSVKMNSLQEVGAAMQQNLTELLSFKKQLEDQAAMVTGKGADVLRSPFDESNKSLAAGGYGK